MWIAFAVAVVCWMDMLESVPTSFKRTEKLRQDIKICQHLIMVHVGDGRKYLGDSRLAGWKLALTLQ
jgi:hypothetical protein